MEKEKWEEDLSEWEQFQLRWRTVDKDKTPSPTLITRDIYYPNPSVRNYKAWVRAKKLADEEDERNVQRMENSFEKYRL